MRYLSLVSLFLIQTVFADHLMLKGEFEEPKSDSYHWVCQNILFKEGVSAQEGGEPRFFALSLSEDMVPSANVVERAIRGMNRVWHQGPNFRKIAIFANTLKFSKTEGNDLICDEFLVKSQAQWLGEPVFQELALEPTRSLALLSSLVNPGPLLLPQPFKANAQNPYGIFMTLKNLKLLKMDNAGKTTELFFIGEK